MVEMDEMTQIEASLFEITGQKHPTTLTVDEAAGYLRLSPASVRRAIVKGDLTAVRYPGLRSLRVDTESAIRFRLGSQTEPAAATADSENQN